MERDKYIIYLQIDEATGAVVDAAWRTVQLNRNNYHNRKRRDESRIISIAEVKKAIKKKLFLLDVLILNTEKPSFNDNGELILFVFVNKKTKEVESVSFSEPDDYDKKNLELKMEIINYREREKEAKNRLDPIEDLVNISFPEEATLNCK